jgi:hypothetical protein
MSQVSKNNFTLKSKDPLNNTSKPVVDNLTYNDIKLDYFNELLKFFSMTLQKTLIFKFEQ